MNNILPLIPRSLLRGGSFLDMTREHARNTRSKKAKNVFYLILSTTKLQILDFRPQNLRAMAFISMTSCVSWKILPKIELNSKIH